MSIKRKNSISLSIPNILSTTNIVKSVNKCDNTSQIPECFGDFAYKKSNIWSSEYEDFRVGDNWGDKRSESYVKNINKYAEQVMNLKSSISYYKNESLSLTETITRQNLEFISWQNQLQKELIYLCSLLTRAQNKKYENWKENMRNSKSRKLEAISSEQFEQTPHKSEKPVRSLSEIGLNSSKSSKQIHKNIFPVASCFGLDSDQDSLTESKTNEIRDIRVVKNQNINAKTENKNHQNIEKSTTLPSPSKSHQKSQSNINLNNVISPRARGIFNFNLNSLHKKAHSLTNFSNENDNNIVQKAIDDSKTIRKISLERDQLIADKKALLVQIHNSKYFDNSQHEQITTLQNQVRELHKDVMYISSKNRNKAAECEI